MDNNNNPYKYMYTNHNLWMINTQHYLDINDDNTDPKTLIDEGFDLDINASNVAYIPDVQPVITKELIDYAHSKGRVIGAGTVNLASIDRQYRNWGIDFITTDYYNPIQSVNEMPESFD